MALTCISEKQLREKTQLTPAEITAIEQLTLGQSNELWKKARQGRLTASRFYNIHTRIETVKLKSNIGCDTLDQRLLNQLTYKTWSQKCCV